MKTKTDKRIDDALQAGVTLRFTGRAFENAATPGAGDTFSPVDVMRRVRAGRAWQFCEKTDNANEILVRSMPRGDASARD